MEAFKRKRLSALLEESTEFSWLSDDVLADDRLQRRGEVVSRISYFSLDTGATGKTRLRVYFSHDHRVTDFKLD